jgi:hypothetical protein
MVILRSRWRRENHRIFFPPIVHSVREALAVLTVPIRSNSHALAHPHPVACRPRARYPLCKSNQTLHEQLFSIHSIEFIFSRAVVCMQSLDVDAIPVYVCLLIRKMDWRRVCTRHLNCATTLPLPLTQLSNVHLNPDVLGWIIGGF